VSSSRLEAGSDRVHHHVVHASREARYEVRLLDVSVDEAWAAVAAAVGDRPHLVVTTPTVDRLFGAAGRRVLGEAWLVLEGGEAQKDLAQVECICSRAAALGLGRQGVLVGVGGGVCTDLVTVAASWIRRGMPHIRLPTTLVGQVDASVGVKGAVNFRDTKSYLGVYHPPESVLLVPSLLHTLPARRIREGLSEIVKIAITCDPDLFAQVEAHGSALVASAFARPAGPGRDIVWTAAVRMMERLALNLYEDRSRQRLVDFGHTFSPDLEIASGHALSHGEAVAIDMAYTVCLSAAAGWLDAATRDRVLDLLEALGLPLGSPHLTPELCAASMATAVAHRGGRPNLVLPCGLGRSRFLASEDELPAAVHDAARTLLEARDGTPGT